MDELLRRFKLAEFKRWYVPKICRKGIYKMRCVELKEGVRYCVERDGELIEMWKESGKGYDKIL